MWKYMIKLPGDDFMGMLKKLFTIGKHDECDVIRALIIHRLGGSPDFDEKMIKRMGKTQLMLSPESAIFEIVETVYKFRKYGRQVPEILAWIEVQRSKNGREIMPSRGIMPKPLNLESYIEYRVDIEHGERLSQKFIAEAIRICHKFLES
jgi:hypothetical protein